jgi:hypothetical protein
MRAALAGIAILAGSALVGSAVADVPASSGFGHLTAVVNGPVPGRGAAVELELPDRAVSGRPDMYEAAHGVLQRFATARGLTLAEAAPLVMRLRIDSTAYDGNRPPAAADASSAMARVDVVNQVHLPFDPPPGVGAATYIVHLDLYRPGEPPLWTATVQASAQTSMPDRLIGRMTEALTEVFGMSADRDFTLQCDRTSPPGALCL